MGHFFCPRVDGVAVEKNPALGSRRRNGTRVSFKPDHDIFPDTVYDFNTLKTRLRELAFLNKGLNITLTDKRGEGKQEVYCYEGGLVSFVSFLNEKHQAVNPTVVSIDGEKNKLSSISPCSIMTATVKIS